jgi:hypothetical protein
MRKVIIQAEDSDDWGTVWSADEDPAEVQCWRGQGVEGGQACHTGCAAFRVAEGAALPSKEDHFHTATVLMCLALPQNQVIGEVVGA